MRNIAKIYEKEFYLSNKIQIIAYIIDSCNYNCQYCYNKKPRTNKCLDLNILEQFLVDIYKKTNKNIDLTLIGGEPTLHQKLFEFCKKMQIYKYVSIKLFTNLSQPVNYYMPFLQFNRFSIFASWHGILNNKQNLDFINKAIQLNSDKLTYYVMFENDNWNNSIYAFNTLMNLYQSNVETSLIGGDDDNIYEYSSNQLFFYKNNIQPKLDKKFNSKYIVEFTDGSYCTKSFNDLYLNDNISFTNWKCDAGYNHLYIHVNGNIYQCQSYYDYNALAITNIYNHNAINDIKFKPVICKFSSCSCTYNIKKENLRSITTHNTNR